MSTVSQQEKDARDPLRLIVEILDMREAGNFDSLHGNSDDDGFARGLLSVSP